MNLNTRFSEQIRAAWFRYRWVVLAVAVFLAVIFELVELVLEPTALGSPRYVLELILQGIIVPILLITIQRTETQKNLAVNTLSLYDMLVEQLNSAKTWDELIDIIGNFPRYFLPISGVCLLIRSSNSDNFDVELARISDASLQIINPDASLEMGTTECCRAEVGMVSSIRLCTCQLQKQNWENKTSHQRYCLQLTEANSVVGLLHLYLPISYKLSKAQKDFWEGIMPEISLSVNEATMRREGVLQKAAVETERLRLASDLHDTLGQDLAYLRNKIDHLLTNQSFRQTALIKRELNQMRMVTEEANQTVRNILTVTHAGEQTPLDARLLSYARAIGERASLSISLETEGQPRILDPHMQFQIFLIFREILANIEKHAKAHHAVVKLDWSESDLTILVSDDGCGFLEDNINVSEHFGLTIIETRARELNGYMSLISAPDQGTQISICLPLAHL